MRSALVVAAFVLVAACGSEPSGTDGAAGAGRTDGAPRPSATQRPSGPEAAVETLMRALDGGDCEAVRAVVVTPSEVECDVVESNRDSFVNEGIDVDAIRYEAGPTHGSSAVVTITWGNEYPDESYDVERVDGEWRVLFDSVV